MVDMVFQGLQSSSSWGDPLDRNFDLIKADIERGWMSLETARKVYGAVGEMGDHGECRIDKEASDEARQGLREKRKARAVSGKKFWQKERSKVLAKKFTHVDITNMYKDTLQYEKWHKEFYGFWQLGEDYQI